MTICNLCYLRRAAARTQSNKRIANIYNMSVEQLEAAIQKAFDESDFPPGWPTKHQGVHSELLDTCIDEGIIDFVEYVNENICKTEYSCQGMPPSRGESILDLPSISLTPDQYKVWTEKIGLNAGVSIWAPQPGNVHLNFLIDPWKVIKS